MVLEQPRYTDASTVHLLDHHPQAWNARAALLLSSSTPGTCMSVVEVATGHGWKIAVGVTTVSTGGHFDIGTFISLWCSLL
jgi:hypothetical protein